MPEKTMPIGIVSTDTLRTDHLITKFESSLWDIDGDKAFELINKYKDLFDILNSKEFSPFCEPDEVREKREEFGYLLSDLHDALNEYTPPFCYFGSADGDGACFGCFFSTEAWEEAIRCGEAIEVDSLLNVTIEEMEEFEYIGVKGDIPKVYAITRTGNGSKTSFTLELVVQE